MGSRLCSCGLVAVLLLVWLAVALAEDSENSQVSWSKYQVLVERNIFSRSRGRRSEREVERARPAPPAPERYVVLTGIAKQGEEHIAFFEDVGTGAVSKVRTGDPVLQGRVQSIMLDSIQYEKGGHVVTIELGQNLEGGGATALPPADLGSEAAGLDVIPAAGSSGTTGALGGAESEILQRLRQRRQEELGQ